MAENSKTAEEFFSLHSIYCDCERCKPILCVHCGQSEKNHYHGATGIYCIGFYDSTKVFTPVSAGAAAGGESHK
jgi:hypothetical protein